MATFNARFNEKETLFAQFDSKDDFNSSFGDVQVIPTGDYNALANKPSINEVVLKGNKTFEDLGDITLSNIEIKQIFDRVFKGGN